MYKTKAKNVYIFIVAKKLSFCPIVTECTKFIIHLIAATKNRYIKYGILNGAYNKYIFFGISHTSKLGYLNNKYILYTVLAIRYAKAKKYKVL